MIRLSSHDDCMFDDHMRQSVCAFFGSFNQYVFGYHEDLTEPEKEYHAGNECIHCVAFFNHTMGLIFKLTPCLLQNNHI